MTKPKLNFCKAYANYCKYCKASNVKPPNVKYFAKVFQSNKVTGHSEANYCIGVRYEKLDLDTVPYGC